jgi:large subunit ribosomal protein L3
MDTEKTTSVLGLFGVKLGMSHMFREGGECEAVTLVQLGPCIVTQRKTINEDGYSAVQVGFGEKRANNVNKPDRGHVAKCGKGPFQILAELKVGEEDQVQVGDSIVVDAIFEVGDYVDVCGNSLGRGFSGVVRRHGMKGQPSTRGTHEVRRHVGSVGCRKTPGRIFKNKRMPGRLGGTKVTIQNLRIASVNNTTGVVAILGALPGPKGSVVLVKRSYKKHKDKKVA